LFPQKGGPAPKKGRGFLKKKKGEANPPKVEATLKRGEKCTSRGGGPLNERPIEKGKTFWGLGRIKTVLGGEKTLFLSKKEKAAPCR